MKELLHINLRMKPKRIQIIITFFVMCVLALLINCGFSLFSTWQLALEEGVIVTIGRGMNPTQIAQLLHDNHVISSVKSFLWSAKCMGVDRKLQAGKYMFQGRLSNYLVLRKLVSGDVITEQITIPEGMRAVQIASEIQQKMNIDSTTFMNLVNDSEFSKFLGIHANRLEGYLFPDTYRFYTNITAEEVIQRMVSEFKRKFNDSLANEARYMGFTIHDVVTLASIVEGEAVEESERSIIAAIYLNRLKKGMPLQACPTVQYLLPEGPRRLLKKDLEIDSPYNTYKHVGLPPGPVNNPGMASILAVMYPSSVDYLYLVANGDGTHTFSKTMNDHLQAKTRIDQLRRFYKQ